MQDSVFLGVRRRMVPVPRPVWRHHVSQEGHHAEQALAFMTEDHHRVRYFVVSELPRVSVPLSPEYIAGQLDLPLAHVKAILDDLERNMTFLYRPDGENVVWAYPVTVAETPHKVSFSTGEEVYAA
jgi:hypothetical protein